MFGGGSSARDKRNAELDSRLVTLSLANSSSSRPDFETSDISPFTGPYMSIRLSSVYAVCGPVALSDKDVSI